MTGPEMNLRSNFLSTSCVGSGPALGKLGHEQDTEAGLPRPKANSTSGLPSSHMTPSAPEGCPSESGRNGRGLSVYIICTL